MEEQAKIKGLNIFFKHNPYKKNISIVTVISMNQPSQTGVKFEAFVKQLNLIHKKHGVKKIIIVLTDFLQRHYIALNNKLDFSEISKLSNEKGKSWINENRKSLTFYLNVQINFVILGWKNLYARNDFSETLNKVENLYQKDVKFRDIVDKISDKYANKLFLKEKNFQNNLNVQNFFDAAKSYLLEESAIWGPIFNMGVDFITYPGRKNEAIDYTYAKLFQSKNCSLPWFRYSFEKKYIYISTYSDTSTKKYKSLDLLSNFQFIPPSKKTIKISNQQKEFISGRRHSI